MCDKCIKDKLKTYRRDILCEEDELLVYGSIQNKQRSSEDIPYDDEDQYRGGDPDY